MAKSKKRGLWWKILLAILVVLIAVVAFFGIRNGKIMNETVEQGLSALRESYTVTEASAGEFETIRIYGIMKFTTQRYDVEGLGNLCVMKMNMGVMQMSTFVLTPYDKNMPMLSTDFIYMLNNRKAYVEVYDLVEDTQTEEYKNILSSLQATFDTFSDLEDCTPSSGWYDYLLTIGSYKLGTAAQDDRVTLLFADSVKTYAQVSAALSAMSEEDRAAKLAITQEYCDTMVAQGGVSTSIFKKALGDDVTSSFFNSVFFGPDNYR